MEAADAYRTYLTRAELSSAKDTCSPYKEVDSIVVFEFHFFLISILLHVVGQASWRVMGTW